MLKQKKTYTHTAHTSNINKIILQNIFLVAKVSVQVQLKNIRY